MRQSTGRSGQTADAWPDEGASSKDQVGTREHRRSFRKRLAIVFGCAALVLVAFGAYLAINSPSIHDKSLIKDPNARVGTITGAGEDLDKVVDESMISFSINTDPVFSDGESPGDLTIENLETNSNRFTVTISLKQDGREVYQSGAIDPGQYIASAALSKDLPKGDYPAVATFKTYRISDDSPIGQAAAEITLHVKG